MGIVTFVAGVAVGWICAWVVQALGIPAWWGLMIPLSVVVIVWIRGDQGQQMSGALFGVGCLLGEGMGMTMFH